MRSFVSRWVCTPFLAAVCAACGGEDAVRDAGGASPDAGGPDVDAGPHVDADPACNPLHAGDVLPTFEMEIGDDAWAALDAEFTGGTFGPPTFHPVESFRYGDEVSFVASIRLKGNPGLTWVPPKMQFVVSFNERDPDARFLGLRQLGFDAPPYDPSLLHERLAMSVFRDVGVPAPCANNARLVVNGEYYGLYANVERVDRELLERVFGDELADGDLYQHGYDLETNEETADPTRHNLWLNADSVEELRAVADLDSLLGEWAVEAVVSDHDGFFCCMHNYFIYDHAQRGFVFIAADKDLTFAAGVDWNAYPEEAVVPARLSDQGLIALADPATLTAFVAKVADVVARVPTETVSARVERWAAQIAQAVEEDPNRVHTFETYLQRMAVLRSHIVERGKWVEAWVGCMQAAPEGTDPTLCPDCYQARIGDADYWVCRGLRNWDEALADCAARGGTLALPRDAAEQQAIADRLVPLALRSWIAATDAASEGAFTDPSGAPLPYDAFGGATPEREAEDCVILDAGRLGEWDDRRCSEPHSSVCRIAE